MGISSNSGREGIGRTFSYRRRVRARSCGAKLTAVPSLLGSLGPRGVPAVSPRWLLHVDTFFQAISLGAVSAPERRRRAQPSMTQQVPRMDRLAPLRSRPACAVREAKAEHPPTVPPTVPRVRSGRRRTGERGATEGSRRLSGAIRAADRRPGENCASVGGPRGRRLRPSHPGTPCELTPFSPWAL
jgi:hypothetical protein